MRRGHVRAFGWLVVLVTLVALFAAPHPGATEQPLGNQDLALGPLIAGTASYVGGTFVSTDYAYDDQQGFNPAYPASIDGGNAADLIQLQLALTSEGDLRIRAILETLTEESLPLLGVGFDTDGDSITGADTVPGGQWTAQSPLGLDAFITVASDGGTLLRWNGEWNQVATLGAEVDAASNSMTTVVPRSELDAGGATWRTVGVVGLAQEGNTWIDGSGPIYDLAFVVAEPPGFFIGLTWQEVHQRNVLNGDQSESFGVAEVDFARIEDGDDDLAELTPGYHTLLYHSGLDLGEGVRPMAEEGFESFRSTDRVFAGPYQPYVVRVPDGPGPHPAIVWLHGREGNHTQGAQLSFADFDPGAVLIFPFGRGPNNGFGGTDIFGFVNDISVLGERDVVDVLADVTDRVPIDPDHVLMSGFSMGAVGAFHMAEFYPDLFTGLLSLGGGDFAIIPINHLRPRLLGNLLNVPGRAANGALDPLAHYPAWEEATLTLDLMGDIDYRAYLALRRAHEVYAPLVDCVYLELLGEPRVVDPPRVRYTVNPAFEVDDPATGLVVRHTGAYWVSDLELRDAEARNLTVVGQELDQSENATIDVTTLARPDRTPEHTPVHGAGENVTAGADFCGPNPDVTTNDAWRIRGMTRSSGASQPVSNGMTVEISRYSKATLDLARMQISVADPITATITGDGEATLTMLGPWVSGTEVTVTRRSTGMGRLLGGSGSEIDALTSPESSWTIRADRGALRLSDDFSGSHTYVLTVTDPVAEISIDVKPGDDENAVDPSSQGSIPVALLTDEGFDAPTADPESLTFGRTGDEDSLARRGRSGVPACDAEDVDGDGRADLVCHFRTQAAGFEDGDDEAVLRGRTVSGDRFEGRDAIAVVE